MINRTGRCVCGILIALHYTTTNAKMSCDETRAVHPRARVKRASLLQQFMRIASKETIHGEA